MPKASHTPKSRARDQVTAKAAMLQHIDGARQRVIGAMQVDE